MLLSPTVLLTRVTVLVVDDEEPLRRYITRILEAAGFQVVTARDGSEALDRLRASPVPVQLVITDVSMPTMTGPELAAQMTTEPYPPRVLFVSGDHAFLDLPGPVLKKPFSARNFREMVEWLVQPDAPAAPLSRAS